MNIHLLLDGCLHRKDNTLCFEDKEGNQTFYPIKTVKSIFIYSKTNLDSSAISLIAKADINVFFLNSSRKQIYALYNNFSSQGNYLMNQILGYRNEKRHQIAESLVYSTGHNMIHILKPHLKRYPDLFPLIEEIQDKLSLLKYMGKVDEIMRLEAFIWKKYYSCFSILLGIDFHRIQQGTNDVINSLVNFLNAVLYGVCLDSIIESGLHPSIAFLHATNDRNLSLQYDISECFKPLLIERTIFSMIHNRMISADEKTQCRNGKYLLNEETKKIAIREFYRKLDTSLKIKNRYMSYKQLIYMDCIHLREFLSCKKTNYKPFMLINQ